MHREQEAVKVQDASHLHVGIVASRFNTDITDALVLGAEETLRAWGVKDENVTLIRVPGSFEVPYGCVKLIKEKKPDAIVTLGCIIKGETDHDRYLASSVNDGIMDLVIKYEIPISSGIITANTLEQAVARTKGDMNRGKEAAIAALQSALL